MTGQVKHWWKISKKLSLYLVVLVVLALLGGAFHAISRENLLRNAQEMGMTIAQSYVSEESNNLTVFETLIRFGLESIDASMKEEMSQEEIQDWVRGYYELILSVLGENTVDIYAVVHGRIVAANPWEGDEDYDYANSDWYQLAVQGKGQVVFTNVYTDAITSRAVVTACQYSAASGSVIAFDIFPENLQFHSEGIDLPQGASVYICDNTGVLIYADSVMERSRGEVERYVDKMLAQIRRGELECYDSSIVDLDGNRQGVYYHSMPNGWEVILTVPQEVILDELNQFTWLFLLVMSLGMGSVVIMGWRDFRLSAQVQRASDTVQVLGNSYYALYRVNYEKRSYELIKASDYVRTRVPQRGDYDLLLKSISEVSDERTRQEFLDSFSADSIRSLVTRQVRDYGGDYRRLFGEEYRWVNVRVLFDETLAPGEVVLCFREIDQEKQRQFQERSLLEDALEQARRSEKTKQSFFNNMSHDMRTPLNAILGLSKLVSQNADQPEKVRAYMEKIHHSSRQLLDLVNDILDMSRMEQGKVVLNHQSFDLCQCMEENVAAFRLQAEAEHKDFQVEYHVHSSVVLGDSFRMGQIMNNLLSNAFKFTREGDHVRVTLRQFEDKAYSQFQIVVQDTGIGMSEEFLPKLFEPYSRETTFSSRQIVGTGLGMPIVKSLVTQMSGQINVQSKLGEGTTFTITVPFTVLQEEAATNKEAEPSPELTQDFSLEGKKILLVEDNLVNMEIATEILSMNGLEIVQAWNGREALKLFQQSKPFEYDAILMDMQMPLMGGCEATQHIRAMSRPDAQTVPIIAVTANAFSEDIAATTAAGMDAHISKPIDFQVLCQTMEQLVTPKPDRKAPPG